MAFLFSRSFRRRYLRLRPLFFSVIIIILLDAYLILTNIPPPHRFSPTEYSLLPPQKIFIASINRNSEYMLRLSWSAALLDLVSHLGPENVYVSIVESGSQEGTKDALTDLKRELDGLGVKNTISLGIDVWEQAAELQAYPEEGEDRSGWIFTGRGKSGYEVRRIPYLARLRNQAMEPLLSMSGEVRFEKILWINDVVFTTEDVTTLLLTNQGSYAAACSLDFSRPTHPQIYYDTFALRDSQGHKTSTLTYPYFQSSSSLSSILSNLPIPVKSCWNGMIVFESTPFYSGLKFRGTSDSLAEKHLEGSECCLIHADNFKARDEKGVWMNPNVRVTYNLTTYGIVNPGFEGAAGSQPSSPGTKSPDSERLHGQWPSNLEIWTGIWRNRKARWLGGVWEWSARRVVRKRVRQWMSEGDGRIERGEECLINEMQILFENGWMHL